MGGENGIVEKPATATAGPASLAPTAQHHHAYVSADQERTRRFYEDVVGLPLVAFWIEDEDIMGERHVMSHAFYGLRDGGALAFFNFADPEQQARYAALPQSLFVHLSLRVDHAAQDAIRARLKAAGLEPWEADHGYTYSIYVTDPDGLLVEFSADPPHVGEIDRRQRASAHASLAAWMAGGRAPNNDVRPEAAG